MDDRSNFNLASYNHWIEDHVRFSDLDPLGHVNNNSIGQYFENARAAFYGEITPNWPHRKDVFVLARTAIDFRRELHMPARLQISTGVIKIGRTSLTLANAVFRDNEGLAYGESVSVLINQETRAPLEIPEDIRKLAMKYLVKVGSADGV